MEELRSLRFRKQFHIKEQQGRTVQSQSVWPCKICKVKLSQYTCPRCNLPYCSLECYKSTLHQDCTEAFYKDCVLQQLQADTVDEASKKDLLQKLQQFQADDAGLYQAEPEENDEKQSDTVASLEERFADINLDGKDYEEIWSVLTAEEKHDFEQFVDEEDLSELIEVWQPWWSIPLPKIIELSSSGDSPDIPSARTDIPTLVDHPDLTNLFQRQSPHNSVVFSVLNTLYAYTLVTRLYNGDHHSCAELASDNLLETAVGLTSVVDDQPKQVEQALTLVWLKSDESSLKAVLDGRQVRALTMLDLTVLLQQPVFVQAALSDLHALFKRVLKQAKESQEERQRCKRVVKKLEYFMAFCQWSHDKLVAQLPALLRFHDEYTKETMEYELVQEKVASALSSSNQPRSRKNDGVFDER